MQLIYIMDKRAELSILIGPSKAGQPSCIPEHNQKGAGDGVILKLTEPSGSLWISSQMKELELKPTEQNLQEQETLCGIWLTILSGKMLRPPAKPPQNSIILEITSKIIK